MSISKITTANTGREGLLKINEVIDKSITGVTYQNGLLGIRTQDGTQYTATLPQMPNAVISGGQVEVDYNQNQNFLKYYVTPVVYNCAGNSYSVSAPPALIITLNPGDPTDPRIDFIVGNTSNSLEVIEGTPGTPTVEPFLPTDKTLIGKILVAAGATSTGGTTNEPIDLSAYLPLAGGTMTGNINMSGLVKLDFGDGKYINDDAGIIISNNGDSFINILDNYDVQLFSSTLVDIQSSSRIFTYSPEDTEMVVDGEFSINKDYTTYFKLNAVNGFARMDTDSYTMFNQPQLYAYSTSSNNLVVDVDGSNTTSINQGLVKSEMSHFTDTGIVNVLGVGTSDIVPVDFGTLPLGAYMYSNRNIRIMADDSTDITMQSTNATITTLQNIELNAATIINSAPRQIDAFGGFGFRESVAYNHFIITGSTSAYTFEILNTNFLLAGVYRATVLGLWKTRLKIGQVYQEYMSHETIITFYVNSNGQIDYYAVVSTDTLGDGSGQALINQNGLYSIECAIDFATPYNNTYETYHSGVIEWMYLN
jgi:hypothetical protein